MHVTVSSWLTISVFMFTVDISVSNLIISYFLQVVSTISRGAFGKVYKVIKEDTNEIYALKVLSKSQVQ